MMVPCIYRVVHNVYSNILETYSKDAFKNDISVILTKASNITIGITRMTSTTTFSITTMRQETATISIVIVSPCPITTIPICNDSPRRRRLFDAMNLDMPEPKQKQERQDIMSSPMRPLPTRINY